MNPIHIQPPLARRTFLRGVGGAIVALPHLEIMATHKAQEAPMRMVCAGTYFGFVPQLFFPEQEGKDYKAPELIRPLEHQRKNFTIFSNLDHGTEGVGGHGGVHAFLSGVLSKHAKGYAEKNVTMDQKAAAHVGAATRYPSMQFSTGRDGGNSLSWNRSGVALTSQGNLSNLYALLFQAPGEKELAVLRKAHHEKKSILDLVRHDADILQKRVGKEDKDKLDQYYTSVRQLEEKLIHSQSWLDKSKPKVDYQLPAGATGLDFVDRVPLYYDLMTLALQTDSTRVITFSISDLGANTGGFPVTRGYHQLTHHGKVASYMKELLIIERFHTKQFGRFLDQLEAIREPGGKTLLENTMALLGSGMGNASSHSNKNLPLLLAGGGFKHGNHIRYEKGSTPASNLFVTMLQRFGIETDQFNLSTGTLNGFEAA